MFPQCLTSAHRAGELGEEAAIEQLRPEIIRLCGTADAAEGMQCFVERRAASFGGS